MEVRSGEGGEADSHFISASLGKKKRKTSFVLLTGRLELPRVVIMEPPLSVGSREIEGNCGDQFKLDEFLWMVLITAGSIFYFLFLNFVFCQVVHCTFFCHVSKCALFSEWRVLLEELTAEPGSG